MVNNLGLVAVREYLKNTKKLKKRFVLQVRLFRREEKGNLSNIKDIKDISRRIIPRLKYFYLPYLWGQSYRGRMRGKEWEVKE